jgi:hypothetical protein
MPDCARLLVTSYMLGTSLVCALAFTMVPQFARAQTHALFDAPAYAMDFGNPPGPIAAGDLNGDGRADLLVEDLETRELVPLISLDGWKLERLPPLHLGRVQAFDLVDFDMDGRLDILGFPDAQPMRLHMWRGLGRGLFESSPSLVYGRDILQDYSLIDLNRDGLTDLVAITAEGSDVLRVFRTSLEAWEPAVSTAIGAEVRTLGTGDLNGDRVPDVVTTGPARPSLTVIFSDRHGHVLSTTQVSVPYGGSEVELADFDGDGHVDVAVAHSFYYDFQRGISESGGLRILYGRGDGTVEPWRDVMGNALTNITQADLNGDGRVDLVTLSGNLFHGPGRDTRLDYPRIPYASSIVIADLDADGVRDLAAIESSAGGGVPECRIVKGRTVTLAPGKGDGSFGLTPPVGFGSVSGLAYSARAGDFDHDGRTDFAVLIGDTVIVMRQDSKFQSMIQSFGLPESGWDLAIGDLDADGESDLVIATIWRREIYVLMGRGGGDFAPPRVSAIPVTPVRIASVDLDDDPRDEVIVSGRSGVGDSLLVFDWTDTEGLLRIASEQVAGVAIALEPFDAQDGSRRVAALLWSGRVSDPVGVQIADMASGTLRLSPPYPLEGTPAAIKGGDLNRDGNPELVVLFAEAQPWYSCGVFDGGITVLRLTDDGVPQSAAYTMPVGNIRTLTDLEIEDLDLDGWPDVALRGVPNEIRVFQNRGDGTLAQDPERFGVSGYGFRSESGDFDGDGRIDLAQINRTSIDLLLNRGPFPNRAQELLADALSHPSSPGDRRGRVLNVRIADSEQARIRDLDPSTVTFEGAPAARWSPIHPAGRGDPPRGDRGAECAMAGPPGPRSEVRDFAFEPANRDARGGNPSGAAAALRIEGRTWTGEPVFATVCAWEHPKPLLEPSVTIERLVAIPRLEPAVGRAGSRPEIVFDLPAASRVSIRMVDVRGRSASTWESSKVESGSHRIRLDGATQGSDLTSGIYFVDVRLGGERHRLRWLYLR